MYANLVKHLPQTCGVTEIGWFRNYIATHPTEDAQHFTHLLKHPPVGAGWVIAGFIETEISQEAYRQLKAKWPIMYQSPVRVNTRTGRKFFFCIYDTKGKVK